MAFYTHDYETGIAGNIPPASHDNIVLPQPGASEISAAGTTVYHAGHVSHGAMGLRQSPASGDVSWINYGNNSSKNFNSSALAARAYFYFTVVPSGAFVSIYDNANQWAAGAGINASGQLFTRDAGANPRGTGTVALTANQWLRIELYATTGTSSATITAAVYAGDSTTPLDLVMTAVGNTTAGVLSSVRFGKNNYNTYATPYWVDSVAFNTTATGLIGPVPGETTPYRVWNGTEYKVADARIWDGSAYTSVTGSS